MCLGPLSLASYSILTVATGDAAETGPASHALKSISCLPFCDPIFVQLGIVTLAIMSKLN